MRNLIYLFIVAAQLITSAHSNNRIRHEINSGWTFTKLSSDEIYPATVPGCVHTDLIANSLIEDPFYGTNEKFIQWIGHEDWTYTTEFDIDEKTLGMNNLNMIFKGLDTYCDVFLNDSLILRADNMFREWRIDVKGIVRNSNNTLVVKFKNVFDVNLPKWNNAPYKLQAFPNNDQADTMIAMYSRKAQYHYGWDWGPRLITYGIWRPVILEAWNKFKLEDLFIIQNDINEKNASLTASMEVESDCDQEIDIQIKVDEADIDLSKTIALKKGKNLINLDFEIPNPTLWWTNGLGSQHLYNIDAFVKNSEGMSDSVRVSVGIRSLKIVRDTDDSGTSMYVELNGVPVFMKGANYIPQDNFQNRVTTENYDFIIRSAADANMNMLRVWGGGIYEEDIFYELCDKYGILVWQDFMFACAMYPADDQFLKSVSEEIVDNVKRLRNHCSIALYCGNNENEIAWNNWGWKQLYDGETQKIVEKNYFKLFDEIIPDAVSSVDPTRYYHRSSPIAGYKDKKYGEGDIHYWGVWHGQEPFENYNKNIARFVSEYGFQSYPEMSTIEKYAGENDRHLHSEVMLSHQRCMADERRDKEYGNRLIETYMDRNFKTPRNFESYVYVSQLLQAEGVRLAVEAHRTNRPYCMGTLYWQINDCWPVASWSSIDYYGNWKALHYKARELFQQVIIVPKIIDNKIEFNIVNDDLSDKDCSLRLTVEDFSGHKLFTENIELQVKANSSDIYITKSLSDLLSPEKRERSIILSELIEYGKVISSNIFCPVKPIEMKLEKPVFSIKKSTSMEDEFNIEITSDVFSQGTYLFIPGEPGFHFSDNYFDLLPGRTKVVSIKSGSANDEILSKIKIVSLYDSYNE